MNSWKIVGNIATLFGIAFIVFAVFQAVITYEALSINYPGTTIANTLPSGALQISMLCNGSVSPVRRLITARCRRHP